MSLKGVALRSSLGPIILSVARVSNEMASASRFQMRGLEKISGTRHSGRGPTGSLISVNIRVYVHVVALRTVTHFFLAAHFLSFLDLTIDLLISSLNN